MIETILAGGEIEVGPAPRGDPRQIISAPTICQQRAEASVGIVMLVPDLNGRNNACKAVQSSDGAIAIGPVLQVSNKPVNDLSLGALVEDIAKTVAIHHDTGAGQP